ncbi:response regulator [Aquimarina sp. 2201CG5-10]|uniref:response regulator n=1 Tax=Aquimarina callyspongiae TaxID=3098150 RepID=UPI002AB471EB|nr:response regulator [Aquimarina sp. 2201CG5-10]MDY8134855.1 response regulator [Aquimarina sp. 2201CG5-10]
MFKKVLIAEDQQSVSKGLYGVLNELAIPIIETTSYCNNALLKIKASIAKQEPFDLLITDLSFEKDYQSDEIGSGTELIRQVKNIQPHLKVMVFSIENKIGKIRKLINEFSIDAYILKGRRESEDIHKAICALLQNKKYYSDEILKLLHNAKNISEITKVDTLLLELLAKGLKQHQISEHFKDNNIPSGSKRSIEYRLQELKTIFGAETLPHLIAIVKDIGLI